VKYAVQIKRNSTSNDNLIEQMLYTQVIPFCSNTIAFYVIIRCHAWNRIKNVSWSNFWFVSGSSSRPITCLDFFQMLFFTVDVCSIKLSLLVLFLFMSYIESWLVVFCLFYICKNLIAFSLKYNLFNEYQQCQYYVWRNKTNERHNRCTRHASWYVFIRRLIFFSNIHFQSCR
jgi:hypothetical protein